MKFNRKTNQERFSKSRTWHEVIRPLHSVKDVGFCETQNSGYRNPNEGYFAVYDGHGGRTSVDYVERNLHNFIYEGLKHCKNVKDAFVFGYKKTDNNLKKLENVAHCGATSITCLITQTKLKKSGRIIKKLHTGNCGDARAVLSRKGVAQRLSYDHKATDPFEQRRVEDTNGIILADRVSGVLAISRSFGDTDYKNWVVCDPFYTEVRLRQGDDILIIACDGVWDVLEDQEAVDLIKDERTAQKMADLLLSTSLEKGSMDNVSCMVVIL